jgi:predicted Zn finger-like uncharacterized protein
MSLITRCPVCATTFRVQAAQLSARAGRVRCGKCSTVFDGVAALVEETAEHLALEPSPQLGLFDPGRKPAGAPARAAVQEEPVAEFLDEAQTPGRHTLLWAVLAFVAAAALAGQVAFRYRTEIAVLLPEARGYLETACVWLRCQVPLPRRPELMSIDSSDLQADTRRESLIVLNAVIRNRAPFPQEYPSLELTLTDETDRPVLRRVLRPTEYLDAPRAALVARGIPPASEVAFRMNLDAGATRATGYRLYLFYPQ